MTTLERLEIAVKEYNKLVKVLLIEHYLKESIK
ncbi:hypothetical protein LCGC14_0981080 [marine sediment metagenome]|uniref:Uncharacterized protein n=1 Tax=marine sediment metagenome TaxID=412755 RepID=A0A0F9QS21_9ZZZZ